MRGRNLGKHVFSVELHALAAIKFPSIGSILKRDSHFARQPSSALETILGFSILKSYMQMTEQQFRFAVHSGSLPCSFKSAGAFRCTNNEKNADEMPAPRSGMAIGRPYSAENMLFYRRIACFGRDQIRQYWIDLPTQ
jgi:hypothetical protein